MFGEVCILLSFGDLANAPEDYILFIGSNVFYRKYIKNCKTKINDTTQLTPLITRK